MPDVLRLLALFLDAIAVWPEEGPCLRPLFYEIIDAIAIDL